MKNNLFTQIIRFGGVGALCFFVDFCIMVILTELLHADVLLSTAIAFTVSVILNYILSVRFVFHVSQSSNKTRSFWLFVLFSVIGLLLTEGLMKLGLLYLPFIHYTILKIIVTLLVMIYNFITRKLFLENRGNKTEESTK